MIEKNFWSNLKILVKFENFWKILELDFKTFQNFFYDYKTLENNSSGQLEFFKQTIICLDHVTMLHKLVSVIRKY